MAARKVQQEMDKCFKKVDEGILAFDGIHEKIQQSTSAPQREKLEDALKKEIKKLQRLRDQIKTWAAGTDVKDKKPLTDKRKAIEVQMEKFKAVEKEMKTKAFSKEGLAAAAKLDPREREKQELIDFVSNGIEELERQMEGLEAELESIISSSKKGKKDSTKTERQGELDHRIEQHRMHIQTFEVMQRSLENSDQHQDRIKELQPDMKYYIDSNEDPEFVEDEGIYDDLDLDDEEAAFGIVAEVDNKSSNDTQSQGEDLHETDSHARADSVGPRVAKLKSGASDPAAGAPSGRRTSSAGKSPAPHLATLHPPLPSNSASVIQSASHSSNLKPAPVPPKADGSSRLAYSSAAALSGAGKGGIYGMEPLPSANDKASKQTTPAASAAISQAQSEDKGRESPAIADAVATPPTQVAALKELSREASQTPEVRPASARSKTHEASDSPQADDHSSRPPIRAPPGLERPSPTEAAVTKAAEAEASESSRFSTPDLLSRRQQATSEDPNRSLAAQDRRAPSADPTTAAIADPQGRTSRTTDRHSEHQQASNGRLEATNPHQSADLGASGLLADDSSDGSVLDQEMMKHLLPPELHDLIAPFETLSRRLNTTKSTSSSQYRPNAAVLEALAQSQANCPSSLDADKPFRFRRPAAAHPYRTPRFYPQEPLALFDDPAWYKNVDTDTLFFIFYYRQGTYHQYLAAKALKAMSWRFHKRFQTWFQRHEEPKTIVEEFEQGTYRFFDYESTWMNRRKADFKFEYRYLEDELV